MKLLLKRVGIESVELVQDILDEAPTYSMRVDGIAKVSDGAKNLFEALPPQIEYSDKHVLVIRMNAKGVNWVLLAPTL